MVHNSTTYGWLFGQVNHDYLTKISAPIKIGETGRVTLFNEKGILNGHELKKRYGDDMSHYPIMQKPLKESQDNLGGFFLSEDGREKWGMALLLTEPMKKLNLKWGIIVDQTVAELYAPINLLSKILLVIGSISLVLSLIILYLGSGVIVKPIKHITRFMNELSLKLDFKDQLKISAKDEIGEMAASINRLLSQISQGLNEANTVVKAISEGNFSERMKQNYQGDLNSLKQGINSSADSVADVIQQIGKSMLAMKEGQFNASINTQSKGAYRDILQNAETTLSTLRSFIDETNNVMTVVAQGHFNQRIQAQASGQLNDLKTAINQALEQLQRVINETVEVMEQQSNGNLTKRIHAECDGHLTLLKQAINRSADHLNEVITKTLQIAEIVDKTSDEVSHGALDLSNRIQEQAAAIERSAATMEEFAATVQNNAQNATEVSDVVHKVQVQSQQAGKIMDQTLEAMSAIQESSQRISEIVTLIDGIAFQTNLLALNAAVEAARAGEHGRGFAVVAGEVRALAQKSADAAKDIAQLINESVERINQGTKLATESGAAMKEIANAIDTVSHMSEAITKSSMEQSQGISQLQTTFAQIDDVTQRNAAMVEQTSAAAESLHDQAQALREYMSYFERSAVNSGLLSAPAKLS